MDGVMAFRADHERLAPPFHHEPSPSGLFRSGFAEIGELADLVNCHAARLPANLAFSPEQPQGQLFAGIGDPFRNAVGEDRPGLPFQRYSAEPCDPWLPAAAFDGDFERT